MNKTDLVLKYNSQMTQWIQQVNNVNFALFLNPKISNDFIRLDKKYIKAT